MQCNIEGISVENVRVLLAALEFYSHKDKKGTKIARSMFARNEESAMAEELKQRIENMKYKEDTIKEIVMEYEENMRNNFLKEGYSSSELTNKFMYL